jgi:hypothetical protein
MTADRRWLSNVETGRVHIHDGLRADQKLPKLLRERVPISSGEYSRNDLSCFHVQVDILVRSNTPAESFNRASSGSNWPEVQKTEGEQVCCTRKPKNKRVRKLTPRLE